MSYPPQLPYPPPPPPPPQQKSNALKWILIALGGLFALFVLVIGTGSFFVYQKVKSAGIDPELMRKNPGLAIARMAATFNPDSEVVSSDEAAGTVTVRDKNTGKTVTLKFDPEKRSMVVIDSESGKEGTVRITGDGDKGGIDISGPDGKSVLRVGSGGGALPSWLPAYPGASIEGNMSTNTPQGSQNTVSFTTGDSTDEVFDFYQKQLTGFTTSSITKTPAGGLLILKDGGDAHLATIIASREGGQTKGTITTLEKK
jgi:hypothetical protein